MTINRPCAIEALPAYRLRVTYPDGVSGVLDLSDDVGKGVFAPLRDPAVFRAVYIGEYGQIAWSDDLEICSDSAYEEITGRAVSHSAHA